MSGNFLKKFIKKDNIDDKEFDLLYENALTGFNNAYVPYSNFKVGASLLTKDGKVYYGCNVENASYGLTNCAERTCLFKAYSEGVKKEDIVSFLIIGDTNRPISPCGACRQVMSELLNSKTKVYLTNLKKDVKVFTVEELIPYVFTDGDL